MIPAICHWAAFAVGDNDNDPKGTWMETGSAANQAQQHTRI